MIHRKHATPCETCERKAPAAVDVEAIYRFIKLYTLSIQSGVMSADRGLDVHGMMELAKLIGADSQDCFFVIEDGKPVFDLAVQAIRRREDEKNKRGK